MSLDSHGSRLPKVTLAVGYVALLAGTLAAYTSPARGYELSIYAGTPATYWIGIAVALAASLSVAISHTGSRLLRDVGLLLGGVSITSVVALPLIRGYYHFGSGDALTHLGWTRDIVAGRLNPVDMLYPGIHTMTAFTTEIVGVRFGRSQLYVATAFVVVFFVFVTFCVRVLGRAEWAVPVGAFSALLLLPNNNVSVHLMAHPITQSLLFLPLVLYLLLKYVSRTGESTNRLYLATPVGVLLALSSVALVLIHPQGALNVVAIFVAVAAVQFFFRRFRHNGPINSHRPAYVPTAVAIAAFALWTPRHPRVQRTASTVFEGLLFGATPADEIAQRSVSLEMLGGDIVGLFVKLFLVAAVFCQLAGALAVLWYFGHLDDRYPDRNALLTYVIVSLVPLSGAFLVFFAASMTTQHFRYVGFVMVPITILGAVAISDGAARLRPLLGDKRVRVGLVVLFLVLFPLPLATVHASPFIYQPTQDVTEMELAGTEATVERMDRSVAFAGVRDGPRRLLHATQGTERAGELNVSGERDAIDEEVFASNLTTHYDSPRYVPVSRSDYEREISLYRGFRYPQSGFERLESSPGADRVHSNGEYQLYLVGNRTSA